ncbi:karyopherin, partial [Coemansia aciculifera]
MDPLVVNRVVQALECVYSSDTSAEQRREAEAVCEQLRNDAGASAYGLYLADAANGYPAMVRHFGLQVVEHVIRHRYGTEALDAAGCIGLRDRVYGLIFNPSDNPLYIRAKLAELLVMVIVRAWPSSEWADLSAQLMRLYGGGGQSKAEEEAREMALSVWRTLGEEMFVYERDPVVTIRKSQLTNGVVGALLPKSVVDELYPSGYRTDSVVKKTKKAAVSQIVLESGNEDGWLLRWAQYTHELSAAFQPAKESRLVAVIDTIAVYLDWVPIRALAATQVIPSLASALLVAGSDAVRRRASEALETITRRYISTGEDRDTVLFLIAQNPQVMDAISQGYAATTTPDNSWEDSAEALATARTLAVIAANLVNLHWARKKIETSVLEHPEALLALLAAIARDARHTVAAPVLGCWGTSILRHKAIARDPRVAAQFGGLAEHATQALFGVCRAASVLQRGGSVESAGIDEDEAGEFANTGELRGYLTSDVRTRLLGIVRGLCQMDPAGFVTWILPSVEPVLGGQSETAVAEAAFFVIDTVLASLDELEQQALADGDDVTALVAARGPSLALGRLVVQFAASDSLALRQLATLPALAFLLRPAAVGVEGEARNLLLAVLQKCASSLDSTGDLAAVTVARRASAALVRLALAIPDSLMLVYGDLARLVDTRIGDPAVPSSVKAYLREFQLALIGGATVSCTLAQRLELAQPVVQPMVHALSSLVPALESPSAFIEFLGLPQLDHALAKGLPLGDAEARGRRTGLLNTLSTLFICLGRTLGTGDGIVGLTAVWTEYANHLATPLLLLVRCIHALWNPAHWQHLPWQSSQAHNALFGITSREEGGPEEEHNSNHPLKEARDIANAVAVLRGHAYRCLGKLAYLPVLFTLPVMTSNFTGCLFADVATLTPRHWRLLLNEVMRPILKTMSQESGGGSYVSEWLSPLFSFCTERLDAEWQASRDSTVVALRNVEEEIARDAALRDWTRAWSQLLAELLAAVGCVIPGATQIEHDLMSNARVVAITTEPKTGSSGSNPALGAWL